MATIRYARTDEFWRRGEKYDFLDQHRDVTGVDWRVIEPDRNHLWLTEGMEDAFDTFLPIGNKESKAGDENAIFETYGNGVKTHRDAWAYNFDRDAVVQNMQRTIETYNQHVQRWGSLTPKPKIDSFVSNDPAQISWSRDLKLDVQRGNRAEFNLNKLRVAVYRPFTKQHMFFDRVMNEEVYQFPGFFPIETTETENRTICVTDQGSEKPFMALMSDRIADLHIVGAGSSAQCFPFYTYDEDGGNRRENITDWALAQVRDHYADPAIDKWAIFHYVYGLLHHPGYRQKYAANLRRSLPRLPFAPDFWSFAEAGRVLAEMHVHYEAQPEYPLEWIENRAAKLDFRVERMKLARDRRSIRYNDFLTLGGIPESVYDYKLGNRSALEWILDRYQVSIDKRSGIANDPNRYSDDPQYIVKLIAKVVHLSVETVKIVETLPDPGVGDQHEGVDE